MPVPIEPLLIAIGFTGALTARWLFGLFLSQFRPPLTVTPHFSPGGACTDVIVKEIAAARREILVLAYGFTSRPIAQALIDARLRGVSVEVILDHSNEKEAHTDMHFLVEQGLHPLIDDHHAIAHNKVIVIDGKTVLTGSFNFTVHAESHNAENLVVIHGHPDLAHTYREDFQKHKAHARAVGAKPTTHAESQHATDAVAESMAKPVPTESEPVVTQASTELFSRLRKELAESGEEDKSGHKPKKKAA